jgi:ATP adenylyltransferase
VVTPLELIWNGWRMRYIEQGATSPAEAAGPDEGSVFTRILASGLSDEDAYIVRRGVRTFSLLNAFPYTSGHVMVLPYREIAALEDLDVEETAELWSMVTAAVTAVKAAYRPGGVNVGLNLGAAAGGSISEHLHVHVVPRWIGDGNFMTAIANARTLPEPLADSAQRLRSAWPD